MSDSTPFDVLSGLLRPFARDMNVRYDTDTNFYLEEELSSSKPQMFGAVQVKKSYTSFHLFPVYTNPELLEDVQETLLKRMQGKSCFNFKSTDQIPVSVVTTLLDRAYGSLKQ